MVASVEHAQVREARSGPWVRVSGVKKHRSGRVRSGNPAKWRKAVSSLARAPVAGTGRFALPAVLTSKSGGRTQGASLTRAAPFAHDDRRSLLILLAPFLIVAFSLASQQALRTQPPLRLHEIAKLAPIPATPRPSVPLSSAPLPSTRPVVAVAPLTNQRLRPQLSRPIVAEAHPEIVTEVLPKSRPAQAASIRTASPTMAAETLLPRLPSIALPPLPSLAVPAANPEQTKLATLDTSPPRPDLQRNSPPVAPAANLDRPLPLLLPVTLPPLRLPPVAPVLTLAPPPTTCAAPPALLSGRASSPVNPQAVAPGMFGRALAAAAHAQLDDLVIYNARYARLSYPMGDVAALYGVCTDVVVRAYRALGIDLQELIYTTKSGRGDIHIDHRRVDVVRRFFEKQGAALAISDYAEDYQPGDVVTYYRPQNRTSTTHIAIVSDKLAPSGRLMIIHNRGWGPQLEDALFVDKITGHYRFTGLRRDPETPPAPAAPSDSDRIRTPLPATWHIAGLTRAPVFAAVVAAPLAPKAWRQAGRELCLPHAGHDARQIMRDATTDTPQPVVRTGRRQKLATARVAATAVLDR